MDVFDFEQGWDDWVEAYEGMHFDEYMGGSMWRIGCVVYGKIKCAGCEMECRELRCQVCEGVLRCYESDTLGICRWCYTERYRDVERYIEASFGFLYGAELVARVWDGGSGEMQMVMRYWSGEYSVYIDRMYEYNELGKITNVTFFEKEYWDVGYHWRVVMNSNVILHWSKPEKVYKEATVDCIHAVVCDISAEDYERVNENQDEKERFNEYVEMVRSSEDLPEIKLSVEERFFALKSWVQGIAEAGMGALVVQNEIEARIGSYTSLSHQIMRFLAQISEKFYEDYLFYLEKACIFEGKVHKPSLIANLKVLFKSNSENFGWFEVDKIAEQFGLNPKELY